MSGGNLEDVQVRPADPDTLHLEKHIGGLFYLGLGPLREDEPSISFEYRCLHDKLLSARATRRSLQMLNQRLASPS
jgi:hypothetical protein